MALTIEELRNGIRYWREQQPNWYCDFNNAYYKQKLPIVQPKGGTFDEAWWCQMWPLLREWSATRHGGTRASMTNRAHDRFEKLGEAWATAVAPHLKDDIEILEWPQIAAFPDVVAGIKPVKSPVFTSKFCHLLAPRIFPVADTKAMGNPYPTYEKYFTTAREEWLCTDSAIRDDLIALLTKKIGAPLFDGFPMKCKVIELCLIGRYQTRKRKRKKT